MPLSDINGNIQVLIPNEPYIGDGDIMIVTNECDSIDLDAIPISVIRQKCREMLCRQLNHIKVLLSEEGLPRDWRGVLHHINLTNANVAHFGGLIDPMGAILDNWMNEYPELATMGKLHRILGNIDRWDVVDDSRDFFRKFDVRLFY